MISHVIAVSIQTFPAPPKEARPYNLQSMFEDIMDIFDPEGPECCGDVLDAPEDDDAEGYLDVVITTLVFHSDEPDTVTLVSDRRDLPGQYAPYDFPRLAIVDLLNFGIGGSDDSMFVIARDDTNPDWVFVNYLEHPPVYARLRDIEDFLSATYAAAVPAAVEIDDRELEALLKGSA